MAAKKVTLKTLESQLSEIRGRLEKSEAECKALRDAADLDFDAIDARYLLETLREARAKSDLFWHHRAIDRLTDVLEQFV